MMQQYKLIMFDADGTLRRTTVEGQPCPNKDGEWELMPGVREILAQFDWGSPSGNRIARGIISNQGGVGLGFLTKDTAMRLLVNLYWEAFGFQATPGEILLCPHAPNENCRCRKPAPNMLEKMITMWRVTPQEALFVGDKDSDRQAAENAGCHFMWAKDFFGW